VVHQSKNYVQGSNQNKGFTAGLTNFADHFEIMDENSGFWLPLT